MDWHYIMIENFTIEPGESDTTHLFGEELNGHKDLGYFTETSNSTYELKLIVSETPSLPTRKFLKTARRMNIMTTL